MFRISLVTLHDWMKRGLPFHKQGGRVYFIRSEVLEYVKQKKNIHYQPNEK
ncbi:helix-turn-helix domain-containing protein [Niabella agricola]|uniref:helix-turn-helix domain-containing protein n=1 Tax=Niabella agricola TaxID=2891571 RepID=UPI00387315D9